MKTAVFNILAASILVGLVPVPSLAQPEIVSPATPSIQWEVENRFRLFRNKDHFRGVFDVYASLSAEDKRDRPAFALEEAMQIAAAKGTLHRAFGEKTAVSRYGWTSELTRRTCFENGDRGHWDCATSANDQFMDPRQFDMLAKLDPVPPELAGASCQWSAGEAKGEFPCSGTARLRKMPFASPITLTVESGGKVVAHLENAKAENRTIAGFGDSYASGEGNPDKPVTLRDSEPLHYKSSSQIASSRWFGAKQFQHYPMRLEANTGNLDSAHAAIWLNDQCHRSLYSNQLRAALILALEQPHVAITFTGYGCSGATVHQGVLGYEKDISAANKERPSYDASPQLMRYLRDYCKYREGYSRFTEPSAGFYWQRDLKPCRQWRGARPDAVLLTIGGNDVGFARVIANEVLATGAYSWHRKLLYRFWLQAADPISFDEARELMRHNIPQGMKDLSDAFRKHLGVDTETIIQIGYPLVTKTATGYCGTGSTGMDVHQALGIGKQSTGSEGVKFVKDLNDSIEKSITELNKNGWQFLRGHAEAFAGHSICDGGAPHSAPDARISGDMNFPRPLSYGWDVRWTGFPPSQWKTYRPRTRWFVTPNDAFLTGHYMHIGRGGEWWTTDAQDPTQPLIAATAGGSFHPNAQGNSRIADEIIPVLRKQLKLQQPQ